MKGNHEHNVPYQAVQMLTASAHYQDALSDVVRKIKDYSPKELEEKGMLKGGAVNGEGLWTYINHLAEPLLQAQGIDSKDARTKAAYEEVKGIVKRFGSKGITSDLLESLLGIYIGRITTYVGQKDQETVASMPTSQGRIGVMGVAELTGNETAYRKIISEAEDPPELAGIKAQFETQLREKVTTAKATGTLEDLVAQAEHTGRAHNAHSGH